MTDEQKPSPFDEEFMPPPVKRAPQRRRDGTFAPTAAPPADEPPAVPEPVDIASWARTVTTSPEFRAAVEARAAEGTLSVSETRFLIELGQRAPVERARVDLRASMLDWADQWRAAVDSGVLGEDDLRVLTVALERWAAVDGPGAA